MAESEAFEVAGPHVVVSNGTLVATASCVSLGYFEGGSGSLYLEDRALTAKALAFAPRTLTDFGATALKLRGLRAWSKAHLKTSVTLIRLTEPNAAALTALKNSATFDWTRMTSDCLTVSADGTELVLTALQLQGVTLLVK